ncbi:emp24/gp25L/p24 family/GOLD-domain-containing protein [Chytridium lagenaria]|nr:emp24/gp25L/p24 family/GOLD-domain-containing protein [Chytridium lagenaria]
MASTSATTMAWAAFIAVAFLFGSVSATTLTYRMAPHERACFYTTAKFPGEKIAFYFAVQSGGAFDVDYEVLAPDSSVVLSGQKERQGDYVFAASQRGDFTFCFSNIMLQPHRRTRKKATKAKEDVKPMDEAASRIGQALAGILRDQRYFHTRENRDFDTVKSTEGRIFWFSVSQSAIIVATSVLQVFVIQTFFSKSSGRGRV